MADVPDMYALTLAVKLAVGAVAGLTSKQMEYLKVVIERSERTSSHVMHFSYKYRKDIYKFTILSSVEQNSVTLDIESIRQAAAHIKLAKEK